MQNQIQTYPNYPIGFFDSGLGGLTVLSEIYHLLPNEHLIYLADSKNAPYGKKSNQEIIALSIKNTEKLLALNCKIIVVACNTATTNAIKILRATYPNISFIGMPNESRNFGKCVLYNLKYLHCETAIYFIILYVDVTRGLNCKK